MYNNSCSDNDIVTEKILLNQILDKLNKMESTFISINADLINQNIKMSEIINGKLKEPNLNTHETKNTPNDNNTQNVINKELYYYENNGKIIVYGPGTYDNRPILKDYGDWNSFNKSWDLNIDINILLDKLPKIIKKEKNGIINND